MNLTINPDLQKERDACTFNTLKLTNLLDGGANKTDRRRHIEKLIETDPTGVFDNSQNDHLTRGERHSRALAKFVRLLDLLQTLQPSSSASASASGDNSQYRPLLENEDFRYLLGAVADDIPAALHWIMFVPNIASLADEEQLAKWMPLINDWKMIGCYAQTELGHGSNVRGLETTATFVKDGDDGHFILHSPTVTAAKFWPGTLGRTANHAIVIAKLIDGEGVDHGVHNFLVQLRDFDTHHFMPGVETGDIGPKIGYNNMDNGYAVFNKVILPRRNMLMRFATIDQNGVYRKKSVSDAVNKVAYITMMQVRAFIVSESGRNLAQGLTVAIRYSAVRRQGFKGSLKDENQILDYKQQQYRLLPLLASSYCFFFAGRKILDHLKRIEERLISGSGDISKIQVADLHASSSALKSFCSGTASDGLEDARKSCGGHGFLMVSGLPELIGTYLQNPTVEGDNQMLPQQVSRVLLKIVSAVQDDVELAKKLYKGCDSEYLIPNIRELLNGAKSKFAAHSLEEVLQFEHLIKAFEHRSARLLIELASMIRNSIACGSTMEDSWNESLVQTARVSRAHAMYLLLENFNRSINDHQKEGCIGTAEVAVMKELLTLFALYSMEKDMGDFLEDGYFNSKQASWIRRAVLILLDRVRVNAVSLVDSWDFSDFRLKSSLGRYDGNVYDAIMKSSRSNPFNKTEVGPGYQSIKPLYLNGVGVVATASRL